MTAGPTPGSAQLITAGCVVTADEVLRPGWVRVIDDIVDAVGRGAPPTDPDVDLGDVTVVPGFVDMHVHGGGGAAFTDAARDGGLDAVRDVVALHRRHGTTRMLASLVSASPDELVAQVAALAQATHSGVIAGIHLEGPWLAAGQCGAHDPDALRAPDPREVADLLAAGDGAIRMVTLAPELTGALRAIETVVAADAVAAIGHTDATYDQTRAAIDAGATVATHLFNAMRPVHHREPGAAVALLEDDRVALELIGDGVHLHPATYRWVSRAAGPDRIALVTDAMAAAGMPDGRYDLGAVSVEVTGGVARVAGTDTIAGSTATMAKCVEIALAHGAGPDVDAAMLAVVRQASTTPARALRLPVAGLRPGDRADLVVLGEDDVHRVMTAGAWSADPP